VNGDVLGRSSRQRSVPSINPAIIVFAWRLSPHVPLGKTRRSETLNLLIVAMISARTVNLSYLACERAWSF
jgi:hypothetical protein